MLPVAPGIVVPFSSHWYLSPVPVTLEVSVTGWPNEVVSEAGCEAKSGDAPVPAAEYLEFPDRITVRRVAHRAVHANVLRRRVDPAERHGEHIATATSRKARDRCHRGPAHAVGADIKRVVRGRGSFPIDGHAMNGIDLSQLDYDVRRISRSAMLGFPARAGVTVNGIRRTAESVPGLLSVAVAPAEASARLVSPLPATVRFSATGVLLPLALVAVNVIMLEPAAVGAP